MEKENLEEISKVYSWFDLNKNGGGDIDLADYPLKSTPRTVLDYDSLP